MLSDLLDFLLQVSIWGTDNEIFSKRMYEIPPVLHKLITGLTPVRLCRNAIYAILSEKALRAPNARFPRHTPGCPSAGVGR